MSFAAATSIILLAGLVLLVEGLRARRIGGEPHCRICEYNLTGVVSRRAGSLPANSSERPFRDVRPLLTGQWHTNAGAAADPGARPTEHERGGRPESGSGSSQGAPAVSACPECGTAVSRRTVRWGERRRRVVLPLSGAILLAIGAAGMYANFDRNRWIRQYPYLAVVTFAKNGDRDALLELHRRYKNVELSDSATRSLIEEALDVQRTDPAPANLANWLALLDNLDTGRSFTAAQRERYVEQVFHNVKLEPRTRYREGERLMASLEVEVRTAGSMRFASVREHTAVGAMTGTDHDESERFSVIPSIIGQGQMTLKFPSVCEKVGSGEVRYNVRLFAGTSRGGFFERRIEHLAPTVVLPFGEDYQFEKNDDVAMGSRLANAIKVEPEYSTLRLSPDDAVTAYQTRLAFLARDLLPASLVCDVVLRRQDQEFQVGTLMAWKGTKIIDARMDMDKLSSLRDGEIALILRHNPSVVHETAGLEEVYVADLALGPIRIDWPWKPEESRSTP